MDKRTKIMHYFVSEMGNDKNMFVVVYNTDGKKTYPQDYETAYCLAELHNGEVFLKWRKKTIQSYINDIFKKERKDDIRI